MSEHMAPLISPGKSVVLSDTCLPDAVLGPFHSYTSTIQTIRLKER